MATHLAPPSLPADLFRKTDVFEREMEAVFMQSWLYVGRVDPLREPGSYLATTIAGQNALLVRGQDGLLRGFHNVCRHRGALLCDPGAGKLSKAIKCPYHAWAYSLEGELIGTPHVSPEEIDRSTLGLLPLPVEEWQGLVFADIGGEAGPLQNWLEIHGGGAHDLGHWDFTDLVVGHTAVREVEGNWKIVVENYLECLHCPTVHPELSSKVPTWGRAITYEADRGHSGVEAVEALTLSGDLNLPPLKQLSREEASMLFGAYVFPNAFVNLFGSYLLSAAIFPKSETHTTVVSQYAFDPETVALDDFDPSPEVDFIELVARQDADVIERTQRGLVSRAFTEGVLPEKEIDVADFHRRYLSFAESV